MKITALDYIQRGWSPIPIPYRTKAPVMEGWQNLILTPDTVAQYFTDPNVNIGVLLGTPSHGLVDVDIDCTEAYSTSSYFLPSTASVFGRLGKPRSHHLFLSDIPKTIPFAEPAPIRGVKPQMLIELRSTGGQTIFPGSDHKDTGEAITWDSDGPPATIEPALLLRAVSLTAASALIARNWPAGRQSAALALAGALKNSRWFLDDTLTFMTAVCSAAKDEEIDKRLRCVEDTYNNPKPTTGWPRLTELLTAPITSLVRRWLKLEITTDIESRCFADITAVPLVWLWPGRIAQGKLTLIAGNPGGGKSQLTLSLAGIVSTGGSWPVTQEKSVCGAVVLLNAEDDASDSICPRLKAAGADLSRCHILDAIHETDRLGTRIRRSFNLKLDLERLGELLVKVGDVRLVIIDPISAYLGGADSHNNAEVRAILGPLSDIAARYGASVIAVSHLNKNVKSTAQMRVMGSIGFIGAARAAYLVEREPLNPDTRLLIPLKNNLGMDTMGYTFTIQHVLLPEAIETSCVAWGAKLTDITADEVSTLEGDSTGRLDGAREFLRQQLASGPVYTRELKDLAINGEGLCWKTIERAKVKLGIQVSKVKDGWTWQLPTEVF